MAKRDVGKLGEKALDTWATQAGISINKAFEDATGWDFFLESLLEEESTPKLPLDKEKYPLKCLVQVKSTDKKPGRWPIKLDNWIHLVKNPLPTFFLICEFDSEETCQRAYLVHIGKTYIHQVLRKLREIGSEKRKTLHKIKLQLKYGEQEQLSLLNGKGLVEAIQKYVGENLEEFSAQKMELVKSIGYEEGNYRATLTIQLPQGTSVDPLDYMIDFSLGLVDRLETKRIEFKDLRFGIEAPELTRVLEDGFVEIKERQPVGKAEIIFFIDKWSKELKIEADVFVPQGFAFDIDEDHFKFRLKAPFMDLVSGIPKPGNLGQFNFHVPDSYEKHKLEDLHSVSSLILLLHDGLEKNIKVRYEIKFQSKQIGGGYFTTDFHFDDRIIEIAVLIHQAWTIAKYFDIQHTIELQIIELLQQKQRLSLISQILENVPLPFRVSLWSDLIRDDENRPMCIPLLFDTLIGKYHLVVAVALLGIPSQIDQKGDAHQYEVVTKGAEIFRTRVIENDIFRLSELKTLLDTLIKEHDELTDVILTKELHGHLLDE